MNDETNSAVIASLAAAPPFDPWGMVVILLLVAFVAFAVVSTTLGLIMNNEENDNHNGDNRRGLQDKAHSERDVRQKKKEFVLARSREARSSAGAKEALSR